MSFVNRVLGCLQQRKLIKGQTRNSSKTLLGLRLQRERKQSSNSLPGLCPGAGVGVRVGVGAGPGVGSEGLAVVVCPCRHCAG